MTIELVAGGRTSANNDIGQWDQIDLGSREQGASLAKWAPPMGGERRAPISRPLVPAAASETPPDLQPPPPPPPLPLLVLLALSLVGGQVWADLN